MEPGLLGVLLASAFGAEVIGTMAGFGAATVLTPIASWFLNIKTAVAIVAVFHLFGNASRLVFFARHVRWPVVAQFGLPGVLCAVGGAQAAAWLPANSLRIALGIFLLVYVWAEAGSIASMHPAPTTRTLVIGGICSGFVAGLIGTGGAIRSVCLLAFGLPKETYIGTSAMIALLVDATRLPVYLGEGFIPPRLAFLVVSLAVVAFCGAWLGQWLLRRVSSARFKQFVLVMLGLMGVQLVLDGWRGIG